MKFILDIDIADNKKSFAEEIFKSISFVRNVQAVASNEITNSAILQSIDEYETGKAKPTPLNLAKLKAMIDG